VSSEGEAAEARIDAEKEKARYVYRLEVRKLIIDKLFLGLILFALAFAANMAIERYRSENTREGFLLQKRLEAVSAVRAAYSEMFDNFDSFTLTREGSRPRGYHDLYKKSINDFALMQSRWSTLLSSDFNAQLDFHLWIHQAFLDRDVAKSAEYRDFMYDLYQHFGFICRRELGVRTGAREQVFTFEEWSHAEADRKGSEEFLAANVSKWSGWKR
jgi:hypothetical protein